jgi:hypothetical protein
MRPVPNPEQALFLIKKIKKYLTSIIFDIIFAIINNQSSGAGG